MVKEKIEKAIADNVQGVWVPEHSALGHYYRNTKTGNLLPSVNTQMSILQTNDHLTRWRIKKGIEWLEKENRFERLSNPEERNDLILGAQEAYNDEFQEAGDIGTLAHKVVEKYVNAWMESGVKPPDIRTGFKEGADPRAIAAARSAEKLFRNNNIEPIATEMVVGSEKIGVAGTLDFICMFNGKLCMMDFKTSNQMNDKYALQCAAYVACFEEMTGHKIQAVKIAHFHKEYSKVNIYNVKHIRRAKVAVRGLTNLYRWANSDFTKLEKDIKRIKI